MRYVSFEINNFRGIQRAKLDLMPSGANVFTFIGLNESGKTTVLEAIASFQVRANDEASLYQTNPVQIDPYTFVPKHEKATFSGDIYVSATVEFEKDERASCIDWAEEKAGGSVDTESVPNRFYIKRGYRFKNGDFIEAIDLWGVVLRIKEKGKRSYKEAGSESEAWRGFTSMVKIYLPEIVYFPTFLFEQPEKIVLNPVGKERPVDRAYRKVIENIGQSLDKKIDIKTNIVDRIIEPETAGEAFLGLFSLSSNRQQQIDSAISQMSYHLSQTVLSRWSKIFGGSTSNREVRLKLGVDAHSNGSPRVYVQFSLRDGTQPYDISERSLGFRWFFSFLLFTLYRDVGSSFRKTLFLLDEPASNLHAGAQIQLLESFPRIASNGSAIMYSTHSHYMVNPDWLDQANIVSNDGVNYADVTGGVQGDATYSQITVQRYRSFVGLNPDKTTYFQPVLDRLSVIPSRLDLLQPAVMVEGKGDYLVLKYGLWVMDIETDGYAIIPTRGANHFDDLIGILLGWGINFAICCDDDKPGRDAVTDFVDNWGISKLRVFTLYEADDSLKACRIEGMLADSDLAMIKKHFGIVKEPSKSQIQLFFSEQLASKTKQNMSMHFQKCIAGFNARVRDALGIDPRN